MVPGLNEMLPNGLREDDFHKQVRDVLGMSSFDRDYQILAELRRLKQVEAILAQPIMILNRPEA